MLHPVAALLPDYVSCMSAMRVVRVTEVNAIAERLLKFVDQGRYEEASSETGVPQAFMAPSFEREASSDFARSPAQGDRWDRPSVNVPKGAGPFKSWTASAVWSYEHEGLDKVGEDNWTWGLLCYYWELFNGFGYRDAHRMRSPYLWGGTNLQQIGKYTTDHGFDPGKMDAQIGVVPVAMRMAQIAPDLAPAGPWPFALGPASVPTVAPVKTQVATYNVFDIQTRLKVAGFDPGQIDGSFGRKTSAALRAFEASKGLVADGLLDPRTVAALVGKPANT